LSTLPRVFVCVSVLLCSVLPRADAAFSVDREPMAYCRRVSVAPVVDGRLDDACWKGGPAIDGLVLRGSTALASEATRVYLVYDAAGLYAGFRCTEPDMAKLKLTEASMPWRNDSVEVLVGTDRDRQEYYHFILDAAGGRYESKDGLAAESPGASWNGAWKSAVAKGDGCWTAEFFIPAATVKLRFREGMALRANFARNERGLPELSSWGPRVGQFGNAMNFGNVVFGSGPGSLSGSLSFPSGFAAGDSKAVVSIRNAGKQRATVTPRVDVVPLRGRHRLSLGTYMVPPGRSVAVSTNVRLLEEPQCAVDLWARAKGSAEPTFLASYRLTVPPAKPRGIGAVLSSQPWGTVWEANATFKVMPNAAIPEAREARIEISAAANDFEPFQVVLTPRSKLTGLKAAVSDLASSEARLSGDLISVRLVETVPVTEPTTSDCATGDLPDPLVPFESTAAPADRNTSLWFTVRVPEDAKRGVYEGKVTLSADGIAPVEIPLKLRVWGFALPKVSYLRTAYGCSYDTLCQWYGAGALEDQRKIAALVNRNFAEHRIAPINPMWSWRQDTHSGKHGDFTIDFTEYDQGASSILPEMSAFILPGSWMSGMGNYRLGDPEYPRLKVEYLRQIASHFREKGWLDKGYNYIWDEPRPEKYADIVAEAKIWREADLGLKILLTMRPMPELIGSVDIWTPVLDQYNRAECQARQKAGDSVWWYVCMGPHHPFPNNFIDYPAIDHRILHWMNWKYGVTGVLYWQTMFWPKNPWEVTMSKDQEQGTVFGNGDGSLLYPATRRKPNEKMIAGPLDSIRWEMIREGVEDYDYMYMLNEAISLAAARGRDPKAVSAGKAALAEARACVRSPVDYEKDPTRLYAVRAKIAEALEKLK